MKLRPGGIRKGELIPIIIHEYGGQKWIDPWWYHARTPEKEADTREAGSLQATDENTARGDPSASRDPSGS